MMRKSEYALWALLVLAVLAAGSTMVSLARSSRISSKVGLGQGGRERDATLLMDIVAPD